MLLLRAFAFRHIDVRSDHLEKFFIRREKRVARRFNIFHSSVGKDDSELEREISFLAQGLVDLIIYSLAIIWMDSLEYSFPVRKPLLWIKPPYPVAFL